MSVAISGRPVASFALYDHPNDEYRLPLTTLLVVTPIALAGELLRLLCTPIGSAPVFTPVWVGLGERTGVTAPLVPTLVLIAGALFMQVLAGHLWEWPRKSIILRVILWGLLWAGVRLVLAFTAMTLSDISPRIGELSWPPPAILGLAISGAVQEEMVFRAAVLGGGALVLRGLGAPRWTAWALALPVSAALFSIAHTSVFAVGGEAFAWIPFINRLLAGLLYGTIFLRQGLAITTLAHIGFNGALLVMLG